MRSHEWLDRRSLALHEAIAAKLETTPSLLEIARANITRWLGTTPTASLREWQVLLETAPLDEIVAVLRSREDRAARLRQSSPFAGVLTQGERREILYRYDPRRA